MVLRGSLNTLCTIMGGLEMHCVLVHGNTPMYQCLPLGAPFNVHLNTWMQHRMTVVCQLIVLYISFL